MSPTFMLRSLQKMLISFNIPNTVSWGFWLLHTPHEASGRTVAREGKSV